AGAAVLYALAAGAVVSAIGLVLGDELFQLMTVPPEVARLGHDYLSTWLVGGPLVFGFFAVEATFRASGDTRTPFLLLAASVLLSVCLDPLLIAGVGPFPRLGVVGAATASVMVVGGGFLLGIGRALRRAGGRRPAGGAPRQRLLPGCYHGDRDRVPRDTGSAREPLHFGCGGDRGRRPVPAGDRLGPDRSNVRDHSGGCARRGGVHLLAAGREHRAHAVARAARRLVVGADGPAGYLARAVRHGHRPRRGDELVLDEGRLAARPRVTANGQWLMADSRWRL